MSISQRIKVLCDFEGSQKNFALKTGIQRQTVNRIVKEDSGLRSDTLVAIFEAYPNLNMHWLMTGIGEMWTKAPDGYKKNDQVHPLADRAHPEEAYLKMKVIELMEQRIKDLERQIMQRNPDLAKELGIGGEE